MSCSSKYREGRKAVGSYALTRTTESKLFYTSQLTLIWQEIGTDVDDALLDQVFEAFDYVLGDDRYDLADLLKIEVLLQ